VSTPISIDNTSVMNVSVYKYHHNQKRTYFIEVLSDNKSSIKEKCWNKLIPNKNEISKTKKN